MGFPSNPLIPVLFVLNLSLMVVFFSSFGMAFESDAKHRYDSGTGFLIKNSSPFSPKPSWPSLYEVDLNVPVRTIQTFAPVCMGRRSCKIAGRKVLSLLSTLKKKRRKLMH